jgi:hypothetical protein
MTNIEVKKFTFKNKIDKFNELINITADTITIEEARFVENNLEEAQII